MASVSSIYGWAGGRRECRFTSARHRTILGESARGLFDARRAGYGLYCEKCRALGGEPLAEGDWYMKSAGSARRMMERKCAPAKAAAPCGKKKENSRCRRIRTA